MNIIVKRIRGEYSGTFFMFKSDDFRLQDPSLASFYEVVTEGKANRKEKMRADNGRSAFAFVGNNGSRYWVFSDHSARQV